MVRIIIRIDDHIRTFFLLSTCRILRISRHSTWVAVCLLLSRYCFSGRMYCFLLSVPYLLVWSNLLSRALISAHLTHSGVEIKVYSFENPELSGCFHIFTTASSSGASWRPLVSRFDRNMFEKQFWIKDALKLGFITPQTKSSANKHPASTLTFRCSHSILLVDDIKDFTFWCLNFWTILGSLHQVVDFKQPNLVFDLMTSRGLSCTNGLWRTSAQRKGRGM